MKPIILFRKDRDNGEEFEVANHYFKTADTRSAVPAGSLIIPRYSCLPYYKELETDCKNLGSQLVNTYEQFRYIANFEYYADIENLTFKTYFDARDIPDNSGPLIIKGKTNSKKFRWNTHMYCKDKRDAILKASELRQDSMIGDQDIIYREYEALTTFEIGLNDMPVTNEWRFFFYKGDLLAGGYYWSQADKPELGRMTPEGYALVRKAADILKEHNNFFVIDVGELEFGGWKVVEVNAGEMSGLSMINPSELYKNLRGLA